ncbi:hypothetical protein VTK26DRAFT_8084 [Humicola hyalothermophila]
MASQQDLQALLRLLTVTRKVPMMQAMAQIKALQAVDLKSINQIAEAPLATVQSALNDEKAAKLLQNACKAAVKRDSHSSGAGTKHGAPEQTTPRPKRTKTDLFMSGPVEMTPQQLERSLELPLCMDEERISRTVIETNRAPLVLAFAVELLRYTMPEQPLSSRLSLAQAVVSANSRSKAVNLGLAKGPSADEEGWGEGHPRVKIMGREIAVLKRGGYEWRGEETVGEQGDSTAEAAASASESQGTTQTLTSFQPTSKKSTWSTSAPLTLKNSTFVARATTITSPSQRKVLIDSLLSDNPTLKTATHNAWAYRLRPLESNSDTVAAAAVREESFDDGETGAGDLLLRALRDASAVDTLVVLTRWFGGTMLGPDRWRLMRNCVSQALAERLRKTGADVPLGGEALWGLDLEAARDSGARATVVGGYGSGVRAHVVKGLGVGGMMGGGMQIHRPEGARAYLLRSFGRAKEEGEKNDGEGTTATATATATAAGKSPRKQAKSQKAIDAEKEENLGLLLGALRIVFDSWADHLGPAELDRRAWGWYCTVRPEVESGQAGWGAKGLVKLNDVLNLKRKP